MLKTIYHVNTITNSPHTVVVSECRSRVHVNVALVCWSLGSRPAKVQSISLLWHVTLEQSATVSPFSHVRRYIQEISEPIECLSSKPKLLMKSSQEDSVVNGFKGSEKVKQIQCCDLASIH